MFVLSVEANNCYSRVEINSGDYDTAGFVGGGQSGVNTSYSFTNCYYAGEITGKSRVSAWVGQNTSQNNDNLHGAASLNNCYYDKTLFPINFAPSGTGWKTAEMADSSLYTGWDFKENENDTDYTWYIDTDTGYPELHFNKAK